MKTLTVFLAMVFGLTAISVAQDANPAAPAQPAAPATADQGVTKFAPDTIIPAELSKSLDAKKLKAGDPVEAKTTVDMLSNGQIILARDTKIVGHVASVKAHSKDSPDSNLGIAFDHLVMKDGREMPLQASIQAIGAPMNNFGGSGAPVDPSGMQPGPIGGGGGGGAASGGGAAGGGGRSGGGASQPSYPSTGMAGGMGPSSSKNSAGGALSASSQGVVGMKDLSLSASPQASVISSDKKNVHLEGGTQLILKVQ